MGIYRCGWTKTDATSAPETIEQLVQGLLRDNFRKVVMAKRNPANDINLLREQYVRLVNAVGDFYAGKELAVDYNPTLYSYCVFY